MMKGYSGLFLSVPYCNPISGFPSTYWGVALIFSTVAKPWDYTAYYSVYVIFTIIYPPT